MSGILNWALEGYKRLKSQKQFTQNTNDVYEARTKSAYSQNPIQDFVDDKLMRVESGYISGDLLKSMYAKYCMENNEKEISIQELRASLSQLGIFESTKVNKETGMRERIYKGVSYI